MVVVRVSAQVVVLMPDGPDVDLGLFLGHLGELCAVRAQMFALGVAAAIQPPCRARSESMPAHRRIASDVWPARLRRSAPRPSTSSPSAAGCSGRPSAEPA